MQIINLPKVVLISCKLLYILKLHLFRIILNNIGYYAESCVHVKMEIEILQPTCPYLPQ